jgi:hypothetical protein
MPVPGGRLNGRVFKKPEAYRRQSLEKLGLIPTF